MMSRSPWYRRFIVRIVATALIAILAVICTAGTISAQSGVELYMRDTSGYPGQTIEIPIMLNNGGDTDSIVAFQFRYIMDRPTVASYTQLPGEDTNFFCLNPPECTAVDTIIGDAPRAFIDTAGALISGWEFISATSPLIDLELRVTAIADTDFDRIPSGVSPLVFDQKLLTIAVTMGCNSLPGSEGTVVLHGQELFSHFSDPNGNLITPVSMPPTTITVIPPVPGDQNLSGFVDSVDLSEFIECVFFGGCPTCDAIPTDFNCDGQPDSIDLSILIEYIYFGRGDLPVCQ